MSYPSCEWIQKAFKGFAVSLNAFIFNYLVVPENPEFCLGFGTWPFQVAGKNPQIHLQLKEWPENTNKVFLAFIFLLGYSRKHTPTHHTDI